MDSRFQSGKKLKEKLRIYDKTYCLHEGTIYDPTGLLFIDKRPQYVPRNFLQEIHSVAFDDFDDKIYVVDRYDIQVFDIKTFEFIKYKSAIKLLGASIRFVHGQCYLIQSGKICEVSFTRNWKNRVIITICRYLSEKINSPKLLVKDCKLYAIAGILSHGLSQNIYVYDAFHDTLTVTKQSCGIYNFGGYLNKRHELLQIGGMSTSGELVKSVIISNLLTQTKQQKKQKGISAGIYRLYPEELELSPKKTKLLVAGYCRGETGWNIYLDLFVAEYTMKLPIISIHCYNLPSFHPSHLSVLF